MKQTKLYEIKFLLLSRRVNFHHSEFQPLENENNNAFIKSCANERKSY